MSFKIVPVWLCLRVEAPLWNLILSGAIKILQIDWLIEGKFRGAGPPNVFSRTAPGFLFIVIGAGVWVYSPTSSQPSKFGIFATNLPIKCDSLVPFTRNSQHTHTENLSVMVAIGRRMHNQERPIDRSKQFVLDRGIFMHPWMAQRDRIRIKLE